MLDDAAATAAADDSTRGPRSEDRRVGCAHSANANATAAGRVAGRVEVEVGAVRSGGGQSKRDGMGWDENGMQMVEMRGSRLAVPE